MFPSSNHIHCNVATHTNESPSFRVFVLSLSLSLPLSSFLSPFISLFLLLFIFLFYEVHLVFKQNHWLVGHRKLIKVTSLTELNCMIFIESNELLLIERFNFQTIIFIRHFSKWYAIWNTITTNEWTYIHNHLKLFRDVSSPIWLRSETKSGFLEHGLVCFCFLMWFLFHLIIFYFLFRLSSNT